MVQFFKVFGRGVLYTVLLPFILVVWVLYGVYCLIIFIIMFIKSLIGFFKGESVTGETKEDQAARKMILEQEQAQQNATQMMSAMYQNVLAQAQAQQTMMQQNPGMMGQQMYQQPVPQPAPQPATELQNNAVFAENTGENTDILNENEEGGTDNESY